MAMAAARVAAAAAAQNQQVDPVNWPPQAAASLGSHALPGSGLRLTTDGVLVGSSNLIKQQLGGLDHTTDSVLTTQRTSVGAREDSIATFRDLPYPQPLQILHSQNIPTFATNQPLPQGLVGLDPNALNYPGKLEQLDEDRSLVAANTHAVASTVVPAGLANIQQSSTWTGPPIIAPKIRLVELSAYVFVTEQDPENSVSV